MNPERIFVALDSPSLREIVRWRDLLAPTGVGFKIGLEAFTSIGPVVVEKLVGTGARVFLDLKFHDIPNTVAGAVRSAASLGVFALNLHIAAGGEALSQAVRELDALPSRPRLWGVTVLSSLAASDCPSWDLPTEVLLRARLAREAGLNGVVASGGEILSLRNEFPENFDIVVPGIRPAAATADDQRRVLTPASALAMGADFLVIGRPITRAADPLAAVAAILEEVSR